MRTLKINLLLLICLLISNILSFAQQTPNPVEYMNEVMTPLTKTKDDTWQYLKAVTRGKGARKVESKRQNLLAELKSAKYEVKRKRTYQSDASLKNAAVKYLEISYIVLKEDFDKILDMEDIAEQSYDMMEAYLLAKEKANDKMDIAFDSLVFAQDEFASKHDITLREGENDKTSEKIKKANEVLKYYNEIYLIFFKVYKQEIYVLDAMQRSDINSFEQNTNTLALFAEEGLNQLHEIKGYRGDANLRVSAQRTLRFYKTEAEQDFPAMIDFYIKKDNFEKVQKSFEAKSKKTRTQQDIDQYNKAGNEYNAAAQKANQIGEKTNTARSKALDNWTKMVENFFDTHSK